MQYARLFAGLVTVTLLIPMSVARAAQFWSLDHLSTTEPYSYAYKISADGRLVVGESNSPLVSQHGEGVQWRRTGSVWHAKGLGLPAAPAGALNSPATGVAEDRTVTVGRVSFGPPTNLTVDTYAYAWYRKGGFMMLPMLQGYMVAEANGATEGGAVIVGLLSKDTDYRHNERPAVWRTAKAWTVALLDPAEGHALAIDRQGRLIAGWLRPPSADPSIGAGQAREGIVWSWQGGAWHGHWLKSLDGDKDMSEAHSIANPGHFVVGYSGSLAGRQRPVLWRVGLNGQAMDIKDLGMLPGYTSGTAEGVSASGGRIVGVCNRILNDNFEYEAFVWDRQNGMRSLRVLLGGDPVIASWTYLAATGISDDGRTICGYGSVKGVDRAWVASLP